MTVVYFIDDSGRDDPPVFVLGGLAVSADRIPAFEADWQAVLAKAPSLAVFKMKDAHGRRGAFKGWTDQARDRKLRDLVSVIRRHAQALISISVRHDDYADVFRGRMMDSLDHPYELLFHLIIAEAFKQQRRTGGAAQAAFVFDRQQNAERSLERVFDAFEDSLVPEIQSFLSGRPRHADDGVEVILQAADMIAWHVRRAAAIDGGLVGTSVAQAGLGRIPGAHVHLDRERLNFFAQTMRRTVLYLNTLMPHDQARVNADFPAMATFANHQVMATAVPFSPVELVSLPAIGTARFRLVRSCEALHKPHLHRRRENACLGTATAV